MNKLLITTITLLLSMQLSAQKQRLDSMKEHAYEVDYLGAHEESIPLYYHILALDTVDKQTYQRLADVLVRTGNNYANSLSEKQRIDTLRKAVRYYEKWWASNPPPDKEDRRGISIAKWEMARDIVRDYDRKKAAK